MNIIIDIGNSFTKVSLFKNNDVVEHISVLSNESDNVVDYIHRIQKQNNINAAIISSVGTNDISFLDFLKKTVNKCIIFDNTTHIPIKNLYKTPETLGKDRLAGVVAAHHIFYNQNVLIFDAGTALTVDFINSSGEYKGGNISPGLDMRFKALNSFTKKIPLLKIDNELEVLQGHSTYEAVVSGVQNGIIYEINGYILRYKRKFKDLKIIFTGGDAFFFEKRLKNKIFAEPNLVMKGLNLILNHNV